MELLFCFDGGFQLLLDYGLALKEFIGKPADYWIRSDPVGQQQRPNADGPRGCLLAIGIRWYQSLDITPIPRKTVHQVDIEAEQMNFPVLECGILLTCLANCWAWIFIYRGIRIYGGVRPRLTG